MKNKKEEKGNKKEIKNEIKRDVLPPCKHNVNLGSVDNLLVERLELFQRQRLPSSTTHL